ncbi:MAG TPA: N-acetylglucosamine-6-phosphate deacetylase [Candidatus Acetothermia bacterium]|nr:N-acetylglucosamine-6-phosphate deacetylase [Candidatus Acetothermia bacterium]
MNAFWVRGGKLVFPCRVRTGDVLIADGSILALGEQAYATGIQNLLVPDLYVAPGFIDLQVNGGAGHNFEDATPREIRKIVDFYVSHGTTGLLPTTVTAPIAEIRETISRVKEANRPAVLGMHIEGPFISNERKGAQNPEHILDPSVEKFNELVEGHEGFIKIVTLAPERPGANQLITRVREIGAVPSLGHSDATYEQALAAIERGIGLFTHMFNAMREFHHRAPGAVGAALDSDVYVELICDGIHVHPAAVRLVARAKGVDRICLVTDAFSATGLPDGEYSLGGLPVFVRGGVARLPDGTLAGSTLTMDRAVKNFMEFTGCSLPEAVRCASLNPARLLGIDDRKGSLEVGKDADLVIFDEDLTVHYTILGGEVVYERRKAM